MGRWGDIAHVSNTQVINQVGASGLRATLNCEEFAKAHSSTSHYDVKSFVGLAWRPSGEGICCEIYSTGRANLPGSVVERQLHSSYMRMLPELLRYSSAHSLLSEIDEETQNVHRTDLLTMPPPVTAPSEFLWDGWASTTKNITNIVDGDDEEDVDLSYMGL